MVRLTDDKLQELWQLFKDLGQDGVIMNHYDLAENTTEKDPEIWKAFLMDKDVSTWIRGELQVIQDSEIRKMVNGVSTSRSVGQAQIMNTLTKMNEGRSTKEGPAFIYCYVPLDENQEQAENIQKLAFDPFLPKK